MQYQQWIHDYLNGELSEAERLKLFDGLATNSEWRDELALQMQMQQVIQKDLTRIAVPAATTSTIFSVLGYSASNSVDRPKIDQTHKARRTLSSSIFAGGVRRVLFVTIGICTGAATVFWLVGRNQVLNDLDRPIASKQIVSNPVSADTSDTKDSSLRTGFVILAPSGKTPEVASTGRTPAVGLRGKGSESIGDDALPRSPIDEASRIGSRATPSTPFLNEPIKFYIDLGKFTSVDYLTANKVIGVAERGRIYCSEDTGRTWVLQETHTSHDLLGVHFSDTARGIVVGAEGTILTTNDAGRSWTLEQSPTEADLITVRFASSDTAYACGARGTVVRTTTGGHSWQQQTTPTTASLFKIQFENGRDGIVRGERGIAIRTSTAGSQWQLIP